jgi:hypothetical protein
MSLSTGRRSHWVVVASCLVVVALATAFAVYDEPASKGATAGRTGAAPASGSATAGATAGQGRGAGAHRVEFGLAYGSSLFAESDAALAASLDDAVTLGAVYIRTDLPWDSVQETGPAQYDWGEFDRIATAARVRGLKIDAILDDPPYWARQTSCHATESCPPADVAAFAAFASAAATRYAPLGVHTWEVWNEPNIRVWAPQPDPAAYEKLLKAASAALRAADPKAFVILGGLAAVPTDPKSKYVSAFDFLTAVAKLGGTKYVDAVGFHPYSLPTLPSVAANFQTVSAARDNLVAVLQQYGTPKVSIWLTETGAQVNQGVANLPANQVATPNAEAVQAAYATDLVKTVKANPNVGADFWYSDMDAPQAALYFGLRGADGKARPSFDALKNAIANCGCAEK